MNFVKFLFFISLPEWTRSVFTPTGELQRIAEYFLKFSTETTETKKLKSGFLLKEILERFQKKSEAKLEPDRSLWLYSGHDVTLGSILNSLGLFEVVILCKFSTNILSFCTNS